MDRQAGPGDGHLPRSGGPADRAMELARYVAAVPAVAFVLLSMVVMVWGAIKGVTVTADLVRSK